MPSVKSLSTWWLCRNLNLKHQTYNEPCCQLLKKYTNWACWHFQKEDARLKTKTKRQTWSKLLNCSTSNDDHRGLHPDTYRSKPIRVCIICSINRISRKDYVLMYILRNDPSWLLKLDRGRQWKHLMFNVFLKKAVITNLARLKCDNVFLNRRWLISSFKLVLDCKYRKPAYSRHEFKAMLSFTITVSCIKWKTKT